MGKQNGVGRLDMEFVADTAGRLGGYRQEPAPLPISDSFIHNVV